MLVENLHIATVISNTDPDQEGKVQIQVEAWMKPPDFNPAHYPWARQFSIDLGSDLTHGVSLIPEVGSKIWVFFEKPKLKKNPYYLAGVHLQGLNPAMLFNSSQANTMVGASSQYPDVKFIILKNGLCVALSSSVSTPEIIIFHPMGTYLYVDPNGVLSFKSVMKVKTSAPQIEETADTQYKVDAPMIQLGSTAPGKVVTTATDPLVDNITGAPHVGSTSVMASS